MDKLLEGRSISSASNPGVDPLFAPREHPTRLTDNTVLAVLARPLDSKHFLLVLAFAGFLFRIALLIATRRNTIFYDETYYETLGISLWKAHAFAVGGFATAYRPPGEPFLIGTIFAVFGQHPFFVKLVHVLLFTAVPFFCARLAQLLGIGKRGANASALCVAMHPTLNYAATTLYPTILTTVALTAGIFYCAVAYHENRTSFALKGGAALGLAGFATTTFMPLAGLVALWVLFKKKFRLAIAIGLVGLLPAAWWTARNRVAMGHWVLATNGGQNLYLGANDLATTTSGNWVVAPSPKPEEIPRDEALQKMAKDWIHQHPKRYGELCLSRALWVVDSVGNPATPGANLGLGARLIGTAMLPFVLLGIAGLVLYRRFPSSTFTAAALALVVLSSAMTIVKPRFRIPVDPLLGTFAVAALSCGFRSQDEDSREIRAKD